MQYDSLKLGNMHTFYRLGWAILFVIAYTLSAVFAAGAGHGTYLFFAPLMPYGLGALLLVVIFFLSDYLESGFLRLVFLFLLGSHYIISIVFTVQWWNKDYPYMMKTWSIWPVYILLPVFLIFLANSFLWYRFFKSLTTSQAE